MTAGGLGGGTYSHAQTSRLLALGDRFPLSLPFDAGQQANITQIKQIRQQPAFN